VYFDFSVASLLLLFVLISQLHFLFAHSITPAILIPKIHKKLKSQKNAKQALQARGIILRVETLI
jgi:hypothetical protein